MFQVSLLAAVGGNVQKSPSSKAAALLTRGAYSQYVSTVKGRERRWRLFSTFPCWPKSPRNHSHYRHHCVFGLVGCPSDSRTNFIGTLTSRFRHVPQFMTGGLSQEAILPKRTPQISPHWTPEDQIDSKPHQVFRRSFNLSLPRAKSDSRKFPASGCWPGGTA